MTSSRSVDDEQPTFEESLERLEQIVRQLEQGRLGLSESLECYGEGIKYLKQCFQTLESAERKIELLAGVDAEGNPVTEAFDDAELSLEEKADARSDRRSRPASGNRSAPPDDDEQAPRRLF